MGRGNGVASDHNMRMNHWGIAEQIRMVMSDGPLMRARPFSSTELGRNGLGVPREGGMTFDISYPGMGGFSRTCYDMFFSGERGRWGVGDLAWFSRYFHAWVGVPGEMVRICAGTIDEVLSNAITGNPNLVVSQSTDPEGIKVQNAVQALHAWGPGGCFAPLVRRLGPNTVPSKSDVDAFIEYCMLLVGVARYERGRLEKARGGAGGAKRTGYDNQHAAIMEMGASEEEATIALNGHLFITQTRAGKIEGGAGGANRTDYDEKHAAIMRMGASEEDATAALGGHPFIMQTQDGKKRKSGDLENQNADGLYDGQKANRRNVTFTENCPSRTTKGNYMRDVLPHMEKMEFKCGCWNVFLTMHGKVAGMSPKEKMNWLNGRKKFSTKDQRNVYKRAEKIEKHMPMEWKKMDKRWRREGVKE